MTVEQRPEDISAFGGEFFISWQSCCARDHLGVIPGPVPPGTIWCQEKKIGEIHPDVDKSDLETAIRTAVRLRSTEGVTALSGGVDSELVAALAGCPALVVGMEGSHDVKHARYVAGCLGLTLHTRIVTPQDIADALPVVTGLITDPTPVDIAIGTTLFFVAETARSLGYTRILTGQGADEIFGGYARYAGKTPGELDELFAADFASLNRQGARDQAIAGHHQTYLSMPYLDLRVICAVSSIPPGERVTGNVRKKPLRDVAQKIIPSDIALYDKKAMQYGTGIWKEIKRLAKENGYQNSVSDFIDTIRRA